MRSNIFISLSRQIGAFWLISSLALCPRLASADEPHVTPYRPTISNPAELPVPGWIDAELGWQYSRGGEVGHRQNIPYVLKFGFSEDWGMLLGGDGYVNQFDPGGRVRSEGYGSFAGLLKHRLTWNDDIHFGLEAGFSHRSLDGGITDYLVNGIYSQDIGPVRLDVNTMLTHAGDSNPGQAPWIGSWAVALGFPLYGDIGGAIEFAGAHQDDAPAFSQFLATLNYSVHPRLVLDIGFAAGMTGASQDMAFFAGMSALLWRVF